MLRTRTPTFLAVLALVLGLVAVAQPAQAAAKRPTVTVKATPTSVVVGSSVTISGTVSGRSPGARVTLQRRTAGAWTAVKTTKVTKNKTYRLRATIHDTKTTFRVRVTRNKRLKAASSRSVIVTGSRTAEDAARQVILRETNEFRAQNGKPPLALMPQLDAIAQAWSVHLAAGNAFEHRPDFTASYPKGWTNAGENIAAGQSPDTVVDTWIASPGHRANLLGTFNYLGIGYATGGPYGRYYTQNFAYYPR
jgi:uncharacterized protein YkwD